MGILSQLNSPVIFLICGSIVLVVALMCVVFAVRAWREGKAMGMDTGVMKKVVTSSAAFSVLPAVAILLGVIALSGALGIPWPWLRLSVIGALHYETQVAQGAAEQAGIPLSGSAMTASAFSTIALLMSVCIMWGMVLNLFLNKKYTARLTKREDGAGKDSFGNRAMTAMFIGLVSAYIGSYIGAWISGNARADFSGDAVPLLTALAAALAMGVLTWLSGKKGLEFLEEFSLALAMLAGMGAAILFRMLFPAAAETVAESAVNLIMEGGKRACL